MVFMHMHVIFQFIAAGVMSFDSASHGSSSFAIYLGLIGVYPCVLVSLFHSSLVSLVVDHLVVVL